MSTGTLVDFLIWSLLILFSWSCVMLLALAIFHVATTKRDDA